MLIPILAFVVCGIVLSLVAYALYLEHKSRMEILKKIRSRQHIRPLSEVVVERRSTFSRISPGIGNRKNDV